MLLLRLIIVTYYCITNHSKTYDLRQQLCSNLSWLCEQKFRQCLLRSLRGTQLVGGWAGGSKTASTTCQVPAGLSGVSQPLTHGFSSMNVTGWSNTLWWFRGPRKSSKKIEVFSFSNLGLEIGTASFPMHYICQSSYRSYVDSGPSRPTFQIE